MCTVIGDMLHDQKNKGENRTTGLLHGLYFTTSDWTEQAVRVYSMLSLEKRFLQPFSWLQILAFLSLEGPVENDLASSEHR